MPTPVFDRYLRYDELTALLLAYASEFPELVTLESIGQSHEGRTIWLVTVTLAGTKPASDKPAVWCDGNIHASEVSASTAVLHILHTVTSKYGKDADISRLLETRTLYLVPRLNPDGAEWALESPPRIVRSSTRPYPFDELDPEGLEQKDLDGDGRILSMRLRDTNGAWVQSEVEPRLMRKRRPDESGGTYYRLIPEGLFHNYDSVTMRGQKIPQGLDFNRNFPSAWRPEAEQYGAGPYPTSEPEIRACVQAICDRPNICAAFTYHTFSGVHLRPPSRYPDTDLPAEDLWLYNAFGEKGTELTGYPAISNYHEFKYHPKEVITGVFDDWMYEHRGVFAWTTEIWSPQRQAGITDYKYIEWFRDHPHEDDIKLLQWSDNKLDGKGYADWTPFDHPQLGPVEIGGWNHHLAFRNPPTQFLEAEIEHFVDWVVYMGLASPQLEERLLTILPIAGGWHIKWAVHNTGYLPTNVTKLAAEKKLCRGVVLEIRRDGEAWTEAGTNKPAWLSAGKLRSVAGQLAGWSHVTSSGFGGTIQATDDVAYVEYHIAQPGKYTLTASHERAGTVTTEIELA